MQLTLKPRHLLAVIVVTLAYRFWLVHHTGITLFIDESYYWTWAQDFAWGYYSKPPLVAWLIGASTWLFGDGVLGVKALAMALYGAQAWAVYLLGRTLLGEQPALMAGVLWALSFTSGLLGLVVSTDALLLLFWTLTLWATWKAYQQPLWRYFIAFGVCVGLGVLSKYTMLAVGLVVPWIMWAVWRRDGRIGGRYWLGGLLALATLVLLVMPHVLWNIQQGAPTLRHTMEITVIDTTSGGWPRLLEFWASQWLMISPIPLAYLLFALATPRTRVPAAGAPRGGALREAVVFLLVPALGLIAVCSLQAYNARAGMNWSAPAFISLTLVFAAIAHARARQAAAGWRHPWTLAVALNVVMVSAIVHAQDIARLLNQPLSSKADVFVRMRGWDALFEQARPVAEAHRQLPLLGIGRTAMTHALYHWRTFGFTALAWNPNARRDDQYMLTSHLPDHLGQSMLFIDFAPLPDAVASRFERTQPLGVFTVDVGPGRQLSLHVVRLDGFKGYAD